MKSVILCVCFMLACVAGQRITTIQLDGVQYFISRMNPYSPELNYFLAYQYCRSLGLQLASFETREKVESMTQYLTNAGYSKYDFWTSGNRLGTGMFLWMSTGLPFNATFDYFESTQDVATTGIDPHDHNSNTSPQRTARDSSSGLEKGCVMLKAPTLKWAPEDCSAVKDFICEQTRCYYYNYGSIPVSSAQGNEKNSRPITPSTPPHQVGTSTTTPMPYYISSTLSTFAMHEMESSSPFQPQFTMTEPQQIPTTQEHEHEQLVVQTDEEHETEEEEHETEHDQEHDSEHESDHESESESEYEDSEQDNTNELARSHNTEETDEEIVHEEEIPVEQKLKQISKEIEAKSNSDKENDRPQSFFSLSDLIKTLRPNDKVVPQIDSDYSNTMRVLTQNTDKQQINRSLY